MKQLITLLAILTSNAAFANLPAQFVGKYSVPASCQLFKASEPKRAYVSFKSQYDGTRVLRMQFFGEDAAVIDVKLGSGQRQAPGTSPEVHGKVIETWLSSVTDPVTLVVKTEVQRPSTHYQSSTYEILKKVNGGLAYKSLTKYSTGKSVNKACFLVKVK